MRPGQGNRIGIDLGGTKIEGIVLDREGRERGRRRVATPSAGAGAEAAYRSTIAAIHELAASLEAQAECPGATVGIGMPGSLSPRTGRIQNANSTWLNDRPFKADMEAVLGREVRLANDANCFAVSEATDGAGAGARSVFGVILGTGCGGGLVIDGRIVDGPRAIGGEWGHNPLPWMSAEEHPGPPCWCGRLGCMETWVSGPALLADYVRATGREIAPETLRAAIAAREPAAIACLDRHAGRLARGLALVTNIIDPEVIVLGGGLSLMPHLYDVLPARMAPHLFAADTRVDIRPPRWGDASGVRGAAWLWG